jgi:hypothetical protein
MDSNTTPEATSGTTTLKDGEFPFYVKDSNGSDPKVKPSDSVQQGAGSGLSADTVQGIQAVTAAVAGPNKLVATGSDGKLPASVLPATSSGYTIMDRPSRAPNTVYQNTYGKTISVNVSTHNLPLTGTFCIGYAGPTSTLLDPDDVVAYSYANGAGVNGFSFVSFFVLPNYHYKIVTNATSSIEAWVEWR